MFATFEGQKDVVHQISIVDLDSLMYGAPFIVGLVFPRILDFPQF